MAIPVPKQAAPRQPKFVMPSTNKFGPLQYPPQGAKGVHGPAVGGPQPKGGQMAIGMPIGQGPRTYSPYPSNPQRGF
eukprot:9027240-Karenia_brevis.AAC.1